MKSHTAGGTVASAPDMAIGTPVRVTQARRISSPLTLRLTGDLRPITQAEVVSRFAGKITEMRLKAGDFVAAGSAVAIIRVADVDQRIARFEASVGTAEQELRVRESELAHAEQRLEHDREIFRRDLIARRDVEQTETVVETARAHAQLAAAHLAQQQAMLAQVRGLARLTRLSASISGEVTSVRVKPGGSVGEGGAIVTLANLDTLKLTLSLSGAAAASLRLGSKTRISSPTRPDISAEGEIFRLEPAKSGSAEMVEVEIHLVNREKYFRPGMLVEAWIDLALPDNSTWIRRSAVSLKEGSYVFKMANGRAVRQNVVLGPEQGEDIAILEGVREGESIILDVADIGSSNRVRPRPE